MKRPCHHKSCPGPLAGDNALERAGASIRGAGGGALRTLSAFARDTSGATAIMIVLLIPVLVGFVGISVDVGLWYAEKRSLQTAADAAVISGAVELVNNNTDEGARTAAVNDAIRNGCDPCVLGTDIIVNIPSSSDPTSPSFNVPGSVEVIITQPLQLFFSRIFFIIRGEDFATTAQVRAVANTNAVQEAACFVSLDPSERDAIGFQSVQAQLTGCAIKVNSNDSRALGISGNSSVVVNQSSVSVTGDVNQVGGGTLTITDQNGQPAEPTIGSAPAPDPFANVDVPNFAGCDSGPNGTTVTTDSPPPLSPGVYCGGLRVQNASVTFDPGIYIIDGGDLEFLTNANIVGDDVAFVLTGDPPSEIGSLTITGGAQLQTTPPDSGDLQGIMFYQDRNAPSGTGNKNRITGGAQLQTDGAFYFPAQELEITGNAQIQVTSNECAGFIARKLSLDSTQIQIDCNPDSTSAIKVTTSRVVRLGE